MKSSTLPTTSAQATWKRVAPRFAHVAQTGLDQAVADVAGVHQPHGVELDDRPLVALAVPLDADEAAQVAVLLVDVQPVVGPEGAERQAEEGEDADGRACQREAQRAGARVVGLRQPGQLAEGGEVGQARRPDLPGAARRGGRPAGHASGLERRSGCGRRPEPSPGSACSAAIVATSRWKRVSPASSGWNEVAMHVALAHGDDAPVVQAGQHVHVRAHLVDDRGPDEDGVDRALAQDRHVEVRLEASRAGGRRRSARR